jgi:hypothetical protein
MCLKGPLWEFFHKGEKQNSAHYKAYCLGCINSRRPAGAGTSNAINIDSDSDAESPGPSAEAWFQAGAEYILQLKILLIIYILALLEVQAVHGDKAAMIAHLIGCPHASDAAKKQAKQLKGGNNSKQPVQSVAESGDEVNSDGGNPRKQKRFKDVEMNMKQSQLKAFRGVDMPFNSSQSEMIRTQFLHATISANLPFRWTTDPEVIKLFLMFRSTATDVMPTNKVISGGRGGGES